MKDDLIVSMLSCCLSFEVSSVLVGHAMISVFISSYIVSNDDVTSGAGTGGGASGG